MNTPSSLPGIPGTYPSPPIVVTTGMDGTDSSALPGIYEQPGVVVSPVFEESAG